MKFEYVFDIGGEPGFAIIQDRDGFLWFSSFYNGMLRFDGSSKWMIREGENGISNDFVTQLFEDRTKIRELDQDVIDRIKTAAEIGDMTEIKSIAEDLKSESEAAKPLCDRIIQLAEDFDFESIQNLMLEFDS